MAIASPAQPNGPTHGKRLGLTGLWARLTRCETEGCEERPVHLGWCALHAPEYAPAPDEYWGDVSWSGDGDDPELDQR